MCGRSAPALPAPAIVPASLASLVYQASPLNRLTALLLGRRRATYDLLRGGTSLVLVHYVFEPRVHQEEEDEVRHPVVLLARRRSLPRRRLLGRRRRLLGLDVIYNRARLAGDLLDACAALANDRADPLVRARQLEHPTPRLCDDKARRERLARAVAVAVDQVVDQAPRARRCLLSAEDSHVSRRKQRERGARMRDDRVPHEVVLAGQRRLLLSDAPHQRLLAEALRRALELCAPGRRARAALVKEVGSALEVADLGAVLRCLGLALLLCFLDQHRRRLQRHDLDPLSACGQCRRQAAVHAAECAGRVGDRSLAHVLASIGEDLLPDAHGRELLLHRLHSSCRRQRLCGWCLCGWLSRHGGRRAEHGHRACAPGRELLRGLLGASTLFLGRHCHSESAARGASST
mmetsp:Transcript_34584/g.115533  ORF Transcript_34584/g.115533 Transcript_34584/m.115533 type:complete len:405 (+) Transcript_34584:74-1288(+)